MEARTKKEPKETFWSKAKKTIGWITTIISLLVLIIAYFVTEETKRQEKIAYEKAQELVTFDDNEQKHDVIDLLDIDYHPLTVGKTMDSLGKTQDTLGAQLQRVDTLLVDVYNQKQRDARIKKTQDSIENIRAIELQEHREKKYKLQEDGVDELILIKNELRNINKRLDTIQ